MYGANTYIHAYIHTYIPSFVLSGDRDGTCTLSDLAAGGTVVRTFQAHRGHCTAVKALASTTPNDGYPSNSKSNASSGGGGGRSESKRPAVSGSRAKAKGVDSVGASSSPSIFLTGGQDGYVKVWDARGKEGCVATVEAHRTEAGAGAVGDIEASGSHSAHPYIHAYVSSSVHTGIEPCFHRVCHIRETLVGALLCIALHFFA